MLEKTGHLASAHREEKHSGCNEDSTKARILWDQSAVRPRNGERRTTANGQEKPVSPLHRRLGLASLAAHTEAVGPPRGALNLTSPHCFKVQKGWG